MKQFVIIFRKADFELSSSELEARTKETQAWAQHQNAGGHKLVPRLLAPECYRSEQESGGTKPVGESEITALLFLEADDFSKAISLANTHPALRYGSKIEVRPWNAPVPG